MSAEARLTELKLELPPAPKPVAVYRPMVIVENLAYVSGHGPLKPDRTVITGCVGRDLDVQGGKLAARQVGLAILATLKDQLGSLDRVRRVIKVLGMVNATADFHEHPAVINGCSELFADVFGKENGIGRAAPSAWCRSRAISPSRSRPFSKSRSSPASALSPNVATNAAD